MNKVFVCNAGKITIYQDEAKDKVTSNNQHYLEIAKLENELETWSKFVNNMDEELYKKYESYCSDYDKKHFSLQSYLKRFVMSELLVGGIIHLFLFPFTVTNIGLVALLNFIITLMSKNIEMLWTSKVVYSKIYENYVLKDKQELQNFCRQHIDNINQKIKEHQEALTHDTDYVLVPNGLHGRISTYESDTQERLSSQVDSHYNQLQDILNPKKRGRRK